MQFHNLGIPSQFHNRGIPLQFHNRGFFGVKHQSGKKMDGKSQKKGKKIKKIKKIFKFFLFDAKNKNVFFLPVMQKSEKIK